MNTKVVFSVVLALCAMQQTTALDIPSQINTLVQNAVSSVQSKLGDVIKNVNSTLTSAADQLASQIATLQQEAEKSILSQLPDLSNLGSASEAAKACFTNEKDNFTKISDGAKSTMQTFIIKEGLKVIPYIGKVNSTINEFKALATSAISGVKECAKKSFLDAVVCDEGVLKTLNAGLVKVGGEVPDEVSQGAQLAGTVTTDAGAALGTLIKNVSSQFQAIVTETVQCVQNALKA